MHRRKDRVSSNDEMQKSDFKSCNRELFRLFKMSVLPIIPNNHDTRSDG